MGLSKEEFTEKFLRMQFGLKQTRLNNAIKDGKARERIAEEFREEGRHKNIRRGNKKKVPSSL